MKEHLRYILGGAPAIGGFAVSFSTIEPILRFTSLLVGITVGILTIISWYKNNYGRRD